MNSIHPKTWGILVLLILLWIVLAVLAPESFLQGNNIENLLRRTAMHGLLGIAVAFVIITGGIDLSVGSLVGLAGCLFAVLLQVSYVPRDVLPVTRVDGTGGIWEAKRIGEGLPVAGDLLRYFGGRRAGNLTMKVESVSTLADSAGEPILRIVGSPGTSADDSSGFLAQATPVVPVGELTSNDANRVLLAAHLPNVRIGDRAWLLARDGSVQEITLTEVTHETNKGKTTLIASNPVAKANEVVGVIPLARKSILALPAAVIAILILGGAIGFIHGTLVTKLGIQPFVVTLCGLLIYRGLARWLVDDRTMGFGTAYANSLGRLASGRWILWTRQGDGASFGIPYVVFLLVFVAVAASLWLNRTIWGRYLFALGRNRDAARYAGIAIDRMTILGYMLCSILTVIGAIAFAADSNSLAPSSFGNFFELYAIAAAVLGGCSLRGGEGSIFGVVIGTALMQTLYNLIVLLKISDKLEFAVIGGVILLGVMADELVRRWAGKRRIAKPDAHAPSP